MAHSDPASPARIRGVSLVALVVACAAFWGLVVTPVWIRVAQYCYAHYDLGIYTQALARLSLSEPNPWLTGRQLFIFNDHFDPVLFLALPLGTVLAQPWPGLVAEALWVFLSGAPLLGLYARGRLGGGATVLGCAVLWLNSGVVGAVNYPIHPTTWAVFPLVWLGVALHAGWRRTALVALVLLFACKEEFPFVGVMLTAGLWLRGDRRFSLQVGAVTAVWLLVAFVVRPWWLGPTMGYGAGLFVGLREAPLDWVSQRLMAPGMISRLGTLLLLFVPLSLWAWRERRGPDGMVLSLLLPMLAIRFLGKIWGHHYLAVVMAGAFVAFLPLLASRRLPAWVALATGVLLVSTNENPLRANLRLLAHPELYPVTCPALPERLAGVGRALEFLRTHSEGKALVSGHLLAHLTARDEVYTVGGLQPEDERHAYRYVLVEKPPHGDAYPTSQERIGELLPVWRASPDTQVLTDDAFIFLARGRFLASH